MASLLLVTTTPSSVASNDYQDSELLRNFSVIVSNNNNGTLYPDNYVFGLHMQHLVLIVMCIFLILMVVLVVGALNARNFCTSFRRRHAQRPRISVIDGQHTNTNGGFNHARKGLLARMIARIEEFDSLTPLIITPNSISEEEPPPQRRSPRIRRGPGKITLVPLGSGFRRTDLILNETVISEEPTRRHAPMAPIHENNGNGSSAGPSIRNPFEDLDLVSIDRTSFNSSLDRRTPGDTADGIFTNHLYSTTAFRQLPLLDHSVNASNVLDALNKSTEVPCLLPTTAAAASSTVATVHQSTLPPSSSSHSLNKAYLRAEQNGRITKQSPSMDSLSSNLSSPMDSVGDSGSPLDTTGSIAELSDSVYMASESDISEARISGKVYTTDTGYTQKYSNGDGDKSEPDISTFEYDTPAGKRYLLHRIEEESEDVEHSKRDQKDLMYPATTSSALRDQQHKQQQKQFRK